MKATHVLTLSLVGASSLFLAASAQADSGTVLGTSVVYAAGPNYNNQQFVAGQSGGTLPIPFTVTPGSFLTFSTNSGRTVSVNGGASFVDADGIGSGVASTSNNGFSGVSGINAPGAGYLTGVFTGPNGPNGPAPASLDFTTGLGTSFASLSPLLDQTFFIGDGLTGDGSGAAQTFFIPTGATMLYLGISTTCGTAGGPACYSTNQGSFTVNVNAGGAGTTPSAVPEPSSLVLLGTGALTLAGATRRRLLKA